MSVIMIGGVPVIVKILRGAGRVARLAVLVHDELRGRDAGPEHTPRADVVPRHGQTSERAFQILQREAGIDQRAEDHVARDTGETIEVQEPGHLLLVSIAYERLDPPPRDRQVGNKQV